MKTKNTKKNERILFFRTGLKNLKIRGLKPICMKDLNHLLKVHQNLDQFQKS